MVVTSIEEVQELYKEIPHKSKFFIALSKKLGNKPNSMKNNWFANTWAIPDNMIVKVMVFMKEYIKNLKTE